MSRDINIQKIVIRQARYITFQFITKFQAGLYF